MIRAILSLLFYGIVMFFVGVYATLHPQLFFSWLEGTSSTIGHMVRKECKVEESWYPCADLIPKPTPTNNPQ
jgi:hypothetical protein